VTRLVHAELLKLVTTRLLLWLGLLILALAILVISLNVSQDSATHAAEPGAQRDIVSFAAASALIALIVGIVASAGEYAHGTAAHTFLAAPVRERVVASKVLAVALTGLALGLFAAVVCWALVALWLAGRSLPIHLFSRDLLELFLAILGASALTGAIGVGFGSVVRRQTAAIVVALVWLLIGEPLLSVAHVQQYAPGHAIAAVVNAGHHSSELLDFGPGLAVALAYVVVLGVLGTVLVKRDDVT
jgi:ABC-type transport system involved in multi-copper enzyme maturation permease subunit